MLKLRILEYHEILIKDIFEYFIGWTSGKGKLSGQANIHYDSEGPNIARSGNLQIDHFRSNIEWSPAAKGSYFFGASNISGKAKIYQFHYRWVSLILKHNVFKLNVAVAYLLWMQVIQRHEQLFYDLAELWLLKLLAVKHMRKKISARTKVSYNK